ncbi:MAG: aldehyde ferredoxin oxidoreductase C-terminal domain-containing protein [Anaerolineae bacterium]|nr:aldehyde ferredoxin oxidoreductase C-terminal domain-containing protein [Anaerolineae bacterium]
MSSPIERLGKHGSANILELINVAGALPTRNFQAGQFEEADELTGEQWRAAVWAQDLACWGCPIHCSKLAKRGDWTLDGPDYETIYAVGTSCGVDDKWAIVEANHICDEYGFDTISAGNTVGFVMELYQRGYVTAADLDGVEATWGSAHALLTLLRKMGAGEGVGRQLAMGTRALSRQYPRQRGLRDAGQGPGDARLPPQRGEGGSRWPTPSPSAARATCTARRWWSCSAGPTP